MLKKKRITELQLKKIRLHIPLLNAGNALHQLNLLRVSFLNEIISEAIVNIFSDKDFRI